MEEVKKIAPAQMASENAGDWRDMLPNKRRRRGMKVKYFKTDEPNLYAVIYHRQRTVFYNLDFAGGIRIYVYR